MSDLRRSAPDARRRGWCPGLARPMPTGDGLLARVHPAGGQLTQAQMRAVAEGARRFGNGLIDITSRANLQLRGVSEATRFALADDLAASGLGDARADGGPQRLTLTSPLAGLDSNSDLDESALARAIEAVGLTVEGLPPKTLVAIDGGGRCGPGVSGADVLLVETAPNCVVLGLAGPEVPLWCGVFPIHQMPGMLGLALCVFAATGKRRMRDLDETERAAVAAAAGWRAPLYRGYKPTRAPEPGLIDLDSDRSAVIVEAPFGRCTADRFDRVADLAEDGVRLTTYRGLALAASRKAAPAIRDALAALDFIVEPSDPRRAVVACPGAPACASGSTPVADHAARLAQAFAGFAGHGLNAHVSGCAKGCAHPASADLTLVAEDGEYGVVLGGQANDALVMRLTFEAALERVRRADPAVPLAEAFRNPNPQ